MRKSIYPPSMPKPRGNWSPAVSFSGARELIFFSGLTALQPDRSIAPDMAGQTRAVLEKLRLVLTEASCSFADICRVDVYVTDIGKFEEIHAVRREYFPQDPPASTMVQISALIDPRCQIEISAIAARP